MMCQVKSKKRLSPFTQPPPIAYNKRKNIKDTLMKNYHRNHPSFALCGLNCALCPIHNMEKGCPGCGGGEGHQSCKIIKCSLEHTGGKKVMEYCSQCPKFPCERLEEYAEGDSFCSHKNIIADLRKAKESGTDCYLTELEEKASILHYLLSNYNDGRKKTFFCQAVNLLSLPDIRQVMESLPPFTSSDTVPVPVPKEKAAAAVCLFEAMAKSRSISLKLRRKK